LFANKFWLKKGKTQKLIAKKIGYQKLAANLQLNLRIPTLMEHPKIKISVYRISSNVFLDFFRRNAADINCLVSISSRLSKSSFDNCSTRFD
jgi:hypothetical protein